MSLLLRNALAADLPAIAAIERVSFAEPWSLASLQQAFDDKRTLLVVAAADEGIVGYATSWYVGDEAELSRLAVLPYARGGGLGTKLLKLLLEQLAKLGVARAFLEVRPSNTAALRLYENAGFVHVGLRRRYYENGEDAIVLSAELALDTTKKTLNRRGRGGRRGELELGE